MIKADGPAKVKAYVVLFALCMTALKPAYAQVSEKEVQNIESQEFGIESAKKQPVPQEPAKPNTPPEDYQPETEPAPIKPIEAEEFRVKLLKCSHTGRVCMFDDAGDNRPRPGKILLLKNGEIDTAAVRVLKNYKARFAAKVILPINEVKTDVEYRALKKLGDKIIHMIREREKRGKDLEAAKTDEDLAKEVSPDDNELDRGIPSPTQKGAKKTKGGQPGGAPGPDGIGDGEKKMPPPLFTKDGQEIDSDGIELKDDDEPLADLSVQEELPLEPYRHHVSLQYGSVRSVDKSNDPTTYSSVGLRYGYHIWRMPFIHRRSIQDMFSLELSMFYFRISDFAKPGDSISVFPLMGTLRYALLFGENLNFFGYLGYLKNNVSQNDGAVSTQTNNLAFSRAVLGAGALIKIGPNWAARIDAGSDMLAIGAVLKF